MGKKAKHPEHENLERWLVSYADFITLLFATFVALYALAQSDLSKLKDVSSAIREGFQEQSIISGINSILQGSSPPSDNPNPLSSEKGAGDGVIGKFESMTYQPGEVEAYDEAVQNIKQDVEALKASQGQGSGSGGGEGQGQGQGKAQGSGGKGSDGPGTHAPSMGEAKATTGGVEISSQERGIRVSFDSRVLFEPGTAIIKPESLKMLASVGKRLKAFDGTHVIHVEGHTDNQPLSNGLFPSNWELSTARSASVVKYLIRQHGFSPSTLVVVGYGDTKPLASNATLEGRAKNRRVDIIIYSRVVSPKVNPRSQYMTEKTLVKFEERDANNKIIDTSERTEEMPARVIELDDKGVAKVIVPGLKDPAKPNIAPKVVESAKPKKPADTKHPTGH